MRERERERERERGEREREKWRLYGERPIQASRLTSSFPLFIRQHSSTNLSMNNKMSTDWVGRSKREIEREERERESEFPYLSNFIQ